MLAKAPIVVSSFCGSPTTTLASLAVSFSCTVANKLSGTKARRIAVHFWPAFVVISRKTSRTNKSIVSSFASGLKIALFTESASMLNGIEYLLR
ncbi:hypothetical protein D3C71_672170 [compost metagenome]